MHARTVNKLEGNEGGKSSRHGPDGNEICPKEGGLYHLYGWANKGQERVLAAADRKRGQHEVTVLNSACVQAIGWAQKSRRMMSTCMLLNRGGAKCPFVVTMYLYCIYSIPGV